MIVINENTIIHIEKALGLKLYPLQKNYLIGKGSLTTGRATGKTVAYCIKLALSHGEPLNLKRPEEFADEWSLPDHELYARTHFKRAFMDIRKKLEEYGFPVREVRR